MNGRGLSLLLELYATTVATLISIHVYTPMAPVAAILVLFGLYTVTIIAYPHNEVKARHQHRCRKATFLLIAVLAIPLLLIGLLAAILALMLLAQPSSSSWSFTWPKPCRVPLRSAL